MTAHDNSITYTGYVRGERMAALNGRGICLQQDSPMAKSHDNDLHTGLSMTSVAAKVYDRSQGLRSGCRSKLSASYSHAPQKSR